MLRKIKNFAGGQLLRDLRSTVLLQVLARFFQIVAVIHAARCLDDANGESSEALGWAQYLQFILTLGLDIVAVRHLAAKSLALKDVVPSIFTVRLLLYSFSALLWLVFLFYGDFSPQQRSLWMAAILNLLALGMNFQWIFQGLQKMPVFSCIQAGTSFLISAYFLAFFRPGIQAGTDLWVMGIFQGIATFLTWWYLKRAYSLSLFHSKWYQNILKWIHEGMPNWVFGLLYNTLITIGMLTIRTFAVAPQFSNHEDAYANLYKLGMAAQFILAFAGSVIYTRIVIWRHQRNDFFARVFLLILMVIGSGSLVWTFLHWSYQWVYPTLFPNPIFQAGAPFLSWMIFGRFFGLASGILVWGLLAYQKDWMVVRWSVLPVLLTVLLHFILIPKHGMTAAVFLNFGGECLLFTCCFCAFLRLRSGVKKKFA